METYEKKHLNQIRSGLAECTVLLKKDGSFPLSAPGPLALYGSGARHTIKGGTGSGEVNSRFFVTVEQGLRNAGFTVTTDDWLNAYDDILNQAKSDFIQEIKARAEKNHTLAIFEGMGAVMPEPEYSLPMDGSGDTAIYVLSRISGEGNDRQPVGGDILLSETEKRDILAANAKYRRFILVLNVGGPIDLSPILEVKNILILSQLGVETGSVLADILLGKAYPSGKLTTTWAAWKDYPTIGEFGDINDTRYREGVFVGYRYFDSAKVQPLFPFGFGLGFTSFSIKEMDFSLSGETVTVTAEITNTGKYAGKEIVQIYVSSPQGELIKPYQALAAFIKTRELNPDESQTVTLKFLFSDLCSYHEESAAYVLEKGDYILRVGTSSRDTQPIGIVTLSKTVSVRKVKNCLGITDFADWQPEPVSNSVGQEIKRGSLNPDALPAETIDYEKAYEIDPNVTALSDEELAFLAIGSFAQGGGMMSIIGNASSQVAGAAGETCGRLTDKGFPMLVMADGPAGIRISREYFRDEGGIHSLGASMPETMLELLDDQMRMMLEQVAPKPKADTVIQYQYCTAIPIGTAIAQSWNVDFAETCGDVVGDEMEKFGIHLWLAPALNIHRSIRCGRNFEYFSEDPFVSGSFAAAITQGVQKHPGKGVTIKHFAANNQETNRYNSNSIVSERAMREIYLRGFAYAIREAKPYALMTSYNLLNGEHTSESRALTEDILRREFGFAGIVMTDWVVNGGTMNINSIHPAPEPWKVAAAGGDLFMPGEEQDYENVLTALKSGRLERKQLEINATRIHRMAKELAK